MSFQAAQSRQLDVLVGFKVMDSLAENALMLYYKTRVSSCSHLSIVSDVRPQQPAVLGPIETGILTCFVRFAKPNPAWLRIWSIQMYI